MGLAKPVDVYTATESTDDGDPIATVVISTKNRRDDLRRAIASALVQCGRIEVLVMDDGSTDGTAEVVCREFPQARLVRSETSQGYIVQRNAAAEIAKSPFLFSIDDDAEFSSNRVVEQTLADFVDDRVGAVAVPCVEVHRNRLLHQVGLDVENVYLTDRFVGTAYAIRRDVFRQLGGFRAFLVHQGEETDFCTRLLDEGYVVRFGTADPIFHHESPRRNVERMDLYGRRNDILYAWCNVPSLYLIPHLFATTIRGAIFGYKVGRLKTMLRGLMHGYRDCFRYWRERRPVKAESYRLSRRLRRKAVFTLDEVDASLKAGRAPAAACKQQTRDPRREPIVPSGT